MSAASPAGGLAKVKWGVRMPPTTSMAGQRVRGYPGASRALCRVVSGGEVPAGCGRLAREVDGYVAAARLPAISGQVVAVMAPHAGHRYSGPVAGYAFAALRGLSPELVAVISPMHYPYQEPLLTTAHEAYATPLGVIPVDAAAVEALDKRLREQLGFGLARVANDPEHSLEIELLQPVGQLPPFQELLRRLALETGG